MGRRFLARGVAHPNLPKPDKFNANLENDAEKERLAKGLAGMVLLHEHDGRTRIGKVLRGYVPKEGRHKGAVVAEFEVTDPEYQRRIETKQLRELSLGQKTTEFSSVFVPKGVVKTEFEELSVVEKGAMPNGPVITDFEVWNDETGDMIETKVLASDKLTSRVLASMKSGAIYDGSPHDVETKPDEKMTEPAQTTPTPPAQTTTPAAAATQTVPAPAQTTPPTQTPPAQPPVTTTPPTQTDSTPAAPADDEEIKALMEASQALANEAKSRGMKLNDYLKQRDAITAEAERISRERAEAEAAEKKRQDEVMRLMKLEDLQRRFQAAAADPEFRKIDRTNNAEKLKEFEDRYLKGDMTMEDTKFVEQMVLASKRVEASKSSGYADYTQQITQSKEERMRQIARDALQNATQKQTPALAPVGTVSDGFDRAPEPTRMSKRPLPSSVTVTASAKNNFVSNTFDLPPGAELDWGVLAPTDEQTMAAEKELAKETKVFASAKSFPMYDDAEIPETPPDPILAAYGLASTQVWASNKPKKPRYGLPDDVKADLRQKMPKPKPGMTKRDSVFVRGNPALVFAMQNYPDFFNNVLRSGAEAPKHDLDVVTPEIRKKYLWKADTPENQQQYRAEGLELRDYFSSGLNPGQFYKPMEHVAAPLAVPFVTPETKKYQWPQ